MNENANPERQPEHEIDDLGLSPGDWAELAIAYNHGLIEPAEGTVEAEVFRRMDAFARQEVDRVWQAQERDREWARNHELEAGHVDPASAARWRQAQTELAAMIRDANRSGPRQPGAERAELPPASLGDWMESRVAELGQAEAPQPEAEP